MSPDPPPDRLGTAARLLALAGALFLAFLLGAWTAWRDVFPFRDAVRDAFLGVQALLDERREEATALKGTKIWHAASDPKKVGVTVPVLPIIKF